MTEKKPVKLDTLEEIYDFCDDIVKNKSYGLLENGNDDIATSFYGNLASDGQTGVSGTFVDANAKTVTVTNGLITNLDT